MNTFWCLKHHSNIDFFSYQSWFLNRIFTVSWFSNSLYTKYLKMYFDNTTADYTTIECMKDGERRWFYFLLSSILTFVTGVVSVIMFRCAKFLFTKKKEKQLVWFPILHTLGFLIEVLHVYHFLEIIPDFKWLRNSK